MLNAESYERVPQPMGSCDPRQNKDTVMECVVECVLKEIVTGECGCHPIAAEYLKTPFEEKQDQNVSNSRECRFEDYQNQTCFNSIQKVKNGLNCKCGQPCTSNSYSISYSTADHGRVGHHVKFMVGFGPDQIRYWGVFSYI